MTAFTTPNYDNNGNLVFTILTRKTNAYIVAACRHVLYTMYLILFIYKIGAPVVISWPHFYDGDESYVKQSVGLQPEEAKHETFIVLEPVRPHY